MKESPGLTAGGSSPEPPTCVFITRKPMGARCWRQAGPQQQHLRVHAGHPSGPGCWRLLLREAPPPQSSVRVRGTDFCVAPSAFVPVRKTKTSVV